ncbi:type II toxin-antitoxin system RelE/ParE family toxin [Coraliomargarita sp. SDUM461003]|uniref:Type II toxin-antitoxin system RelE/ParE family toxin n=1 Tax=Thalassobacterium maritimum TaxID=3041265 RepID=A0ABU1AZ49_9BACT|nr:type II toxin-antitoxin system RelE/ParE family toxin [Coraliomargarita sp. SDUM461003]MDQ8209438.1 type II toxin-antitoxin system RelE/ParE family toxin [Coraliomargarita sp. SDUM461003]
MQIIAYLDERISGTEDPRQSGKQLKGELNNVWRYRSDNYRILCQLQDKVFIVLVLEAGHRKDIYK